MDKKDDALIGVAALIYLDRVKIQRRDQLAIHYMTQGATETVALSMANDFIRRNPSDAERGLQRLGAFVVYSLLVLIVVGIAFGCGVGIGRVIFPGHLQHPGYSADRSTTAGARIVMWIVGPIGCFFVAKLYLHLRRRRHSPNTSAKRR